MLAKVTKKPSSRSVKIANVDDLANSLDGETACRLPDGVCRVKRANGRPRLTDAEGGRMTHEPFFWPKGVNGRLGGKRHSCRSDGADNMPEIPKAAALTA